MYEYESLPGLPFDDVAPSVTVHVPPAASGIFRVEVVVTGLKRAFDQRGASRRRNLPPAFGDPALLGAVTDRDADPEDEYPIQRGITPDRKPEEIERAILDRIDRAKTSEERDSLYLQLANRAAQRGDLTPQ